LWRAPEVNIAFENQPPPGSAVQSTEQRPGLWGGGLGGWGGGGGGGWVGWGPKWCWCRTLTCGKPITAAPGVIALPGVALNFVKRKLFPNVPVLRSVFDGPAFSVARIFSRRFCQISFGMVGTDLLEQLRRLFEPPQSIPQAAPRRFSPCADVPSRPLRSSQRTLGAIPTGVSRSALRVRDSIEHPLDHVAVFHLRPGPDKLGRGVLRNQFDHEMRGASLIAAAHLSQCSK